MTHYTSDEEGRRHRPAARLKPHRVETFKISNDPQFAEKLEDIVGLYLNPPEHALSLSVCQPGALSHEYNALDSDRFAGIEIVLQIGAAPRIDPEGFLSFLAKNGVSRLSAQLCAPSSQFAAKLGCKSVT